MAPYTQGQNLEVSFFLNAAKTALVTPFFYKLSTGELDPLYKATGSAESGYTVSGIISTAGGGGDLTSVTVNLTQWQGNSGTGFETVHPDANGNYTFSSVPSGKEYDIDVTLSGYGSAGTDAFSVTGNVTGKNLTLEVIQDAPFTGTELGLYIGSAASPQANTGALTLAFGWLRENAASNTNYTILIGADESLPPCTLGGVSSGPTVVANGKTGVRITLKGKDVERRVQPSGTGSLFTVNSGFTLVLDEHITLVGISSNNTSLVRIVSASLEMRENAKITGNYGGGGVYVDSGTFTMYDNASVSDNTSTYCDGGGVYVDGGTFTMNDNASVSGNTSSSSAGGVFLHSGTFTMNGGTVYGSDGEANANIATNGTSLYKMNGGTAQYGNQSPIIAGDQTTVLYTDETLTGHN
jgi:hypothetical protein